jgi:hypothetical protein
MVKKAALGQVFSEYFGFPCQSFHQLLNTHYHPSSGAGTIGQKVATVLCGLSLIPSQETKELNEASDANYATSGEASWFETR